MLKILLSELSPWHLFTCDALINFKYYMLQHNINISVETMSLYCLIYSKGKIMLNSIKAITSTLWEILCATGRAKYAAELARNGKYTEAQASYKN